MTRPIVETPWGPVTVMGAVPASPGGTWSTRSVPVPTPAGRAGGAFHIDLADGNAPEAMRLILSGGYGPPFPGPGSPPRSGETTLKVGGAVFGWRAEAWLDPLTGDVADGRPLTVMLADGGGKPVRSYPPAEQAVRKAFASALDCARGLDPAFVGRVYVALMGDVLSRLDGAVTEAEAALAQAHEARTRAWGLVDAVLDSTAGTAFTP